MMNFSSQANLTYAPAEAPQSFPCFSDPWEEQTIIILPDDINTDSQLLRPERSEDKRVTFRVENERDDLQDGFKWRKYGKKAVKSNPYPRNYYKCSSKGCGVKKRVERDPQDQRFLLIAYRNTHNHEPPSSNLNRRL